MMGTDKSNYRGRMIAVGLGWLLLGATDAEARQEVLQWTHPDATAVQRFEALYGTSTGVYGAPVSLGKPTPNASGVFQGSITVGDTANVYVVVRAVGTSGEISPNSGERYRAAPPPPTGGTGGTGGTGTTTPTYTFDGLTAGSAVPGWVDTGAAFSLAADDGLFSIASTSLGGVFTTAATLSDIHSHMASPAPSTTRSYKLRGGMSLGSASGGIGVTFYSGYPTTDAYYRLGRQPGETFKMSARHSMTCSRPDSGYLPTAGGSYSFEIAVETLADRNRIQAKVWTLGGTEPTSPQIVCDDTHAARPSGGTFGVWATGAGTKFWDGFVLQALTTSLPAPPTATTPLAAPILIEIVPVN
ncbi:hypothetical protein K2X89_11900 [Myxococcota bacterium]|nr:hypothetical protein [Myxococcota bacterium]